MNNHYITDHATKRCQQRGIPLEVINFIIENGLSVRSHQDKKYFINKKRLNQIKHSNKAFFIKYDKFLLNTAVIFNDSENVVITAMKIERPVKWN